jgi:hypothetical protein
MDPIAKANVRACANVITFFLDFYSRSSLQFKTVSFAHKFNGPHLSTNIDVPHLIMAVYITVLA